MEKSLIECSQTSHEKDIPTLKIKIKKKVACKQKASSTSTLLSSNTPNTPIIKQPQTTLFF